MSKSLPSAPLPALPAHRQIPGPQAPTNQVGTKGLDWVLVLVLARGMGDGGWWFSLKASVNHGGSSGVRCGSSTHAAGQGSPDAFMHNLYATFSSTSRSPARGMKTTSMRSARQCHMPFLPCKRLDPKQFHALSGILTRCDSRTTQHGAINGISLARRLS